jgi:hypothetical protein
MKIKGFLSVMAAVVMLNLTFASCEKALETDEEQTQKTGFTELAKAYLPETYADKTIAAWYSVYTENDYKSKVEAVFLFTDSAVAVTKSKTYTVEDGREPVHDVLSLGIFHQVEGDFTNGTLSMELSSGMPATRNARIKNGVLTLDGVAYTKQDNDKAPKKAN